MTIDPIPPSVLREAAPYSLSQVAATANDRESQAEGIPPLEVSAAEQQVLRWLRNRLPGPPARRSRIVRRHGRQSGEENPESVESPVLDAEGPAEDEEARLAPGSPGEDASEQKQQETGTLLDDRL
ncbi:MAG: hypothetical protein P4M01_12810 [Acidobacteriota bacterium]|nr:hypothetical protein [Acidobacteriota bacterium]